MYVVHVCVCVRVRTCVRACVRVGVVRAYVRECAAILLARYAAEPETSDQLKAGAATQGGGGGRGGGKGGGRGGADGGWRERDDVILFGC